MSTLKSRLWDVFEQHRTSQRRALSGGFDSGEIVERVTKARDSRTDSQQSVQSAIRPLFGKKDLVPPAFGGHPDFDHLRTTGGQEVFPITTMFMDIEKSTRLGILLPLDEVFRIKNAFLCLTMDIIRAFEGHVHRIMGDAVMAFFGRKNAPAEVGAVAALNCASVVAYFVTEVLIPNLAARVQQDVQFGIRIGLDYGKDVLWAAYGIAEMGELTATSFHVDVASKLQHAAGRNQIMIGGSIREFIDLPDDFFSVKQVEHENVLIEEKFVRPNLIGADGKPINYRQFVLNWRKYLATTKFAEHDREFFRVQNASIFDVLMAVYDHEGGAFEYNYFPGSTVIQKGHAIRFRVTVHATPKAGRLRFVVENHGSEALSAAGPGLGNHEKSYAYRFPDYKGSFEHWETIAYRGCHYMIIEFSDDDSKSVIARQCFAVWAE